MSGQGHITCSTFGYQGGFIFAPDYRGECECSIHGYIGHTRATYSIGHRHDILCRNNTRW